LYDQKNHIGQVTNVLTNSSQTLLAIDAKGVEVLVPLNDEVVKNVNLVEKKILAELPDGLLEMYLENNPNDNED
jgi:16S rRNA processing protein RimM